MQSIDRAPARDRAGLTRRFVPASCAVGGAARRSAVGPTEPRLLPLALAVVLTAGPSVNKRIVGLWTDQALAPRTMSSTATAFEPPAARWDELQATIHTVRAALPPGLVTVRWPDASLEQAVAALDRDGAFILENAASAEACDAVREQMRPYVEACTVTADGSNARRPGAVIGRSRASWALATHPFLRQVCEGVLGRQVLTRTSEEVAAELFADRGFRQHPYYLDISMMIAVGSGGLAQGLHLDTGKHIMDFRPFGLETTISCMWAISDFTADGGATSLCLGSRHWGRWRRPSRDEAVAAVMPKGSCLVFSGNTWHGSGGNTSPSTRWGLNIDYSVAVR